MKQGFQLWLLIVPHIPKIHRSTIGNRIGNTFLEILDLAYQSYYTNGQTKLERLTQTITRLDSLKFFLQIAWENKLIPNEKYIELSASLDEIGKMLGGWKKGVEIKLEQTKTPIK